MDGGDTPQSDRRHRILRWIAALIVYGSYRTVEVKRPHGDITDRPLLVVANHFAGFADPVLLYYGIPRRAHFLAKGSLWRNGMLGRVLDFAGAIPVQRAVNGGTEDNISMFAACHEVLRRGEVIALFPEGTTHDEASLAEIKTGAARIALGARAAGASGIIIVPVGLHYEDKAGFRSRVYAELGEAIDLDRAITDYVAEGDVADDSNRGAVRRLTADIDRRLREVSPDFRSTTEWRALSAAAEVTLRAMSFDASVPVSYGQREEMANTLAALPLDEKRRLVKTVNGYRNALTARGLRDEAVAPLAVAGGGLPDHAARAFLGALGLAPSALMGAVINAIPIAVMTGVRRLDVDPVTMATIRTLLGPMVYGTTWSVWGSILNRRLTRGGRLVAWAGGAVGGWALVLAAERIAIGTRAWSGSRRARNAPGIDEVLARRRAVVRAVRRATGASRSR